MKSLVVLFFGILFWTQSAFASHANVSFYARSGEAFQVVIDGRLMNRYSTDKIRLNDINFGYHTAEIRFPDRYGVLVHRARIYLEPGYETEYRVQVSGRRRNVEMQKMRVIPLNGGIVPPYAGNPRPNPLPDYQDPYRGNDRDDRYRRDDSYGRDGRYDDRSRDFECRDIIKGAEFDRFYRAVADRNFDDDKMALAKQVLSRSTIYAEDLKRVMKLFSFENNKIDLAKFMYPQVCDRRNFYVVYDAFSFESSIREMDRFVNIQ